MIDLSNSNGQSAVCKLSATDVEGACPVALQELGTLINVHMDKARKYTDKADQHYRTASKYLKEAQESCDEGGFKAFQERFFPNLGQSRVYELLAIATDKKSVEEIKEATRLRVAKYRAKTTADSVTVTEKSEALQEGLANLRNVEKPDGAQQHLRMSRAGVHAPNEALLGFSAQVMELKRRIGKSAPGHFADTSIPADDLAAIGEYILELAQIKRRAERHSGGVESAAPKSADDLAIRRQPDRERCDMAG